jgi:hypothetical protein
MARRHNPLTTDPRVNELSRRLRELAHDLAGPKASFEDVEMLVLASRAETETTELRAPRPDPAPRPPPSGPGAAPRRR